MLDLAVYQEMSRRGAGESLNDALLRKVFRHAPIGMAVLDVQGMWLDVNDRFCQIVGYTRAELLSLGFADITAPGAQPEDERHWLALVNGEVDSYSREKQYIHKDGHPIWVHVAVSSVRDADGKPHQVISQVVDIDALRKAHDSLRQQEVLLETILGALPVAVRVADPNGVLLSANLASLELWGDMETGETAAVDCQASIADTGELLTHDDWPMQRALRERCEMDAQLLEVRCYEQHTKTILCAAIPLFDDKNNLTGVVEVAQDMSRWVHLESQVVAHARELESRNKELEQFAYVASHDLQEPLRKISSFVQLFARKYESVVDDTGRQYLGFMVDGATRMQRLIDDLLHYSRVSRGGAELEPVDLERIIMGVLSDLETAAADASAQIKVMPLPVVMGVGPQLRALLQNLIGNAIKYRDIDRPLKICVEASTEAGWVTLKVTDTGIGIDERYFERIFAIFQRLHGRGEYPGTGIGLAICKRVVENHGGKIWVASQPGEGTTFFCTLKSAGVEYETG